MPNQSVIALKYGANQALFIALTLLVPVYGIKWGEAHRRFDWHQLFNRITNLSHGPDLGYIRESFSFLMPWQEKAALIACVAFSAYIGFQIALHTCAGGALETNDETGDDSEDADSDVVQSAETVARKKGYFAAFRDPETVVRNSSYIFLFLYTAACAVCERTKIGTIPEDWMIASWSRDFGTIVLLVSLFLLSRHIVKAVSFNGMLTRDDIARNYKYHLVSIFGLSLVFGAWLPLLALPGAVIMVDWALKFCQGDQTLVTNQSDKCLETDAAPHATPAGDVIASENAKADDTK